MSKKEKLMNLFLTSTEPHITLCIFNPNMEHCEYLTIFREDYEVKSEMINRDYNDDLELYRNTNVKIDSVISVAMVENCTYIY